MVDIEQMCRLYITVVYDRNTSALAPFLLPPNLIPRFYSGGRRIAQFRGLANVGSHESEDWVGSTTTTRASDAVGLSRLGDGTTLRDLVRADPVGLLGEAHVEAYGFSPALLVKLLDAGERLPVHCHPSRAFAQQFLGSRFGKTEAWHVLDAEPGARVYVGFHTPLSPSDLATLVAEQRPGRLLNLLNPVAVSAGDTLLIPGGLPHAIGEGVLIVEVQEPTDQSVILEWSGFNIDAPNVGHLKLGYETALGAVDRTAWDEQRLAQLRVSDPPLEPRVSLLPKAAQPYFSLELIRPEPEISLEPAFAVLIITAGVGELNWGDSSLPMQVGDTLVVPYGAGEVRATGALEFLRCLGPAPDLAQKEQPA